MNRVGGFLVVLFLAGAIGMSVHAADWPHWRGPNRNGITAEDSGWEKGAWPPAAPLWSASVGEGASAPLVVGKQVYTVGWKDGWDIVRCLEAETGKILWEQEYPGPKFGRHAKGDQSMYRGATSTPEFDPESGLLFTLGCDGALNAWDTTNGGKQVWSLNLYQRFDIPQRPQITSRKNTLRDYGYTTSPLVIWNQVIVETGDREGGCLKSFDKRTGELLWSSQNRDPAGHTGGPALIAVDGVPCVTVATSWNVLVVRIDGDHAGKTVAEFEWKTDFSNTIAGVAIEGQDLLIASRYNQMAMARVHVSLRGGAKEIWRNQYPTGVCTPVIHDGKLYFANKGIHCVDFATGKLQWEGGKIGDAGSCLVTADDRLVAWGNSGDLSLVETAKRSPDKCTILSERRGIFNDMAWPHVVAANGRLFCKTLNGDLACFSLTEASGARDSSLTSTSSDPAMPAAAADWKFTAWPGNDPGLVVGWKRGDGPARFSGKAGRVRLEKRGSASLGNGGEMQLAGGGFHVKGVSDALLEAMRTRNELTIELIFRTDNLQQRGPARIVSYSEDPYIRNFTLGQERDQLTLRLRTPITGENGSNPEIQLGRFLPGRLNHVLVSYRPSPGTVVTWLNGKEVSRSDRVRGDFSNWAENQQLILGDEWSGGSRDWAGEIHGFAIFDAAITEAGAARRYRMAVE